MSRMNRKERRSLFMRVGAVLIAICMVAALALPAFAADTSTEDTYSYTVRIFPGDKGTIDGSKDPIVKEVNPGYEWSASDFDYGSQAASDTDKYYVTGMREAGKDNNTNGAYKGGGFTVDRDIDLVISYGIKGSDVAYTINYVDVNSGDPIHSPKTYYGNIGDKPAVAYLYIDGYVPQYKNITGTLQSDASANEWTFYYVDDEDDSVTIESKSAKSGSSSSNGGDITTQSTGSKTASKSKSSTSTSTSTGSKTSTSTGSGTTTASSTGTGTSAGSNSAASVGEGTLLASNGAVNTLRNGPVEIVDVDEQETPLVEYEGTGDENEPAASAESEIINNETEGTVRAAGMAAPVKVLIGAVIVLALAAAGWFYFKKSAADNE